jgi:YD repeat-containing protein
MSHSKAVFVVLAFLTASLFGQTYQNEAGKPTFTSTFPVENGFIDLANGNLHLEIPLVSYAQRGSLPFGAKLVYDSRIWAIGNYGSYLKWTPTNVSSTMGGWRYVNTATRGSVTPHSYMTLCDMWFDDNGFEHDLYDYGSYDFVWTGPDGTTHRFPISTYYGDCAGSGTSDMSAMASDGSGFRMDVTGYSNPVVLTRDGTQVFPTLMDANGNSFSSDTSGNPKDTLNRVPIVKSVVNTSTTDYQYLVPGTSTRSTIEVVTTTISVATGFSQSGVLESGTLNLTVIDHVQLGDGTRYTFGYDSYGELNSVTLPSGGQITYSYSNYADSYSQKNQWVSTRVKDGTWTFTPSVVSTCSSTSVNCSQTVTVNTPATSTATSGENIVYTFNLNGGAWAQQVDTYGGTIASNHLLHSTATTYDYSNSCVETGCIGADYIAATNNITTIPAGYKKQVSYVYDNAYYRNITAVKEWDYIASTASFGTTPTRETDASYVTSSTYLGLNMVSLPVAITVKNSSGTAVAGKQFAYDSWSLTGTSGAHQHDYTNYSTANTTRGLVARTYRCTSSFTSIPCTAIYSDTTYDDTGNVHSVTDPGGHTTTFTYSSSYDYAYPTSVTLPTTGSVSHGTSAAYDSNTGLVTSTTDDNGKTTTYTYDIMFRLHETIFPDYPNNGYISNTYYPIATSGTSSAVRRKTMMDSAGTKWITDFTYFDGFGRPVRTARANDESGTNIWDKQDTCY